MRIGLSTVCARSATGGGPIVPPARLLERLERAAPDFLLLDASLPGDYFEALAPLLAARQDALPVRVVESVFPAARVNAAELASLDRAESSAALAATRETLRIASALGAAHVIVRLGDVRTARARWPAMRRAFLRAELADDEGARVRLLRERKAGAAPHLEVARRVLDALADDAARSGVRVGLRTPARPTGLPSPIELRLLLAELGGAPLEPALDAPAAHLLDVLGVLPLDETVTAFAAGRVALLADACGPVDGLPPGRGELDLAPLVARLPDDALACFVPQPALDEHEVEHGLRALRAIAAARPARPATGS